MKRKFWLILWMLSMCVGFFISCEKENEESIHLYSAVSYSLYNGGGERWIDVYKGKNKQIRLRNHSSVFVDKTGNVYSIVNPKENEMPKIYRNGGLLYSVEDWDNGLNLRWENVQITTEGKDVYWCFSGSRGATRDSTFGLVYKNNQFLHAVGPYLNNNSLISCIYVDKSDVYLGGQGGQIWKNGAQIYSLQEYPHYGRINTISVEEDGLYICGCTYEDGGYYGYVWKNGNPLYRWKDDSYYQQMTHSPSHAIRNGDIYVAREGKVYRNNKILYSDFELGKLGAMYSLCLSNQGDVITGGRRWESGDTVSAAVIWKNGKVLYEFAEEGYFVGAMCWYR